MQRAEAHKNAKACFPTWHINTRRSGKSAHARISSPEGAGVCVSDKTLNAYMRRSVKLFSAAEINSFDDSHRKQAAERRHVWKMRTPLFESFNDVAK